MNALALTLLSVGVVLLVRNQLVYSARGRRIQEIHELNQQQIMRPDIISVMERRYAEMDAIGYDAMIFDLRCWTYRQFYPSEVA